MKPTLIIKNIGALATPTGNAPKAGELQGAIELIRDSYIVIAGQEILEIGSGEVPPRFVKSGAEILDARGGLVTPGLVDAHTHLVFGGWREHELADKLRGVSYLDILKRGGGILSTVAATRAATQDELTAKAKAALCEMLALGTTTCEAKSGYGLTPDDEVKQLNVVKRLKGEQPVELVSTFMGAHAVPGEYMDDKEAYISLIIDAMLPYIAERGLAEYCDVFCETAVFSALEAERILSAAQKLGLGAKIHADEIDAIGGSEVAAELGAVSAEHLIAITENGMDMLAHSGTIAVLLPATSFYLGKGYAPARRMIEKGIPVAVASDFNPGSTPNLSLQLAMNIACYKYLLTPEEALTAVTLNAAASIGRSHTVGTLECGKQADILVWNAPNLDMIFYRYGSNQVKNVIKKGKIIVSEGRIL
jgi:imidazolonepropionase